MYLHLCSASSQHSLFISRPPTSPSSLITNRYFQWASTCLRNPRFCLLYSYCFRHFCLLSDHRMGMIDAATIDTVPMPIKVGTQHVFLWFTPWKCAKLGALNDTNCVSALYHLSVLYCHNNVKCVQNSGVLSKFRRRVKWASNSGSFTKIGKAGSPETAYTANYLRLTVHVYKTSEPPVTSFCLLQRNFFPNLNWYKLAHEYKIHGQCIHWTSSPTESDRIK